MKSHRKNKRNVVYTRSLLYLFLSLKQTKRGLKISPLILRSHLYGVFRSHYCRRRRREPGKEDWTGSEEEDDDEKRFYGTSKRWTEIISCKLGNVQRRPHTYGSVLPLFSYITEYLRILSLSPRFTVAYVLGIPRRRKIECRLL